MIGLLFDTMNSYVELYLYYLYKVFKYILYLSDGMSPAVTNGEYHPILSPHSTTDL